MANAFEKAHGPVSPPPSAMSAGQQKGVAICLDWCAFSGCTFACHHCHPMEGAASKRSKVQKAYYVVGGEANAMTYYTLNPKQATELAKLMQQGKVGSGTYITVNGDAVTTQCVGSEVKYDVYISPEEVRCYFVDGSIPPFPENKPLPVYFGKFFPGIGLIQYHSDVIVHGRDIEARTQRYNKEVIEKFMDEDRKRAEQRKDV